MKYLKVSMMISQEKKIEILEQANIFYKDIDKEFNKARFYVDANTAKKASSFFGHILKKEKFDIKTVIDLTFGSGNLALHSVLDNNIDYTTLILNDKNLEDANNQIQLGDKHSFDVLNPELFENLGKFDLVVFNPLIGGNVYEKGKFEIDMDISNNSLVFHKINDDLYSALQDKYDLSDCDVSINKDEHKITISSNILKDNDIKVRFNKLSIFNYYDVFYQTESENSRLVQFKRTLEYISKNETVIMFYGEETQYDLFFHEYNNVNIFSLPKSIKKVFISWKSDTSAKICYKKESNVIVEVDCNKKQEIKKEKIDLKETLNDIHDILSDLKALDGGELFVMEDKAGISTESKTESVEATSEQNKPHKQRFKNFLLAHIVKPFYKR